MQQGGGVLGVQGVQGQHRRRRGVSRGAAIIEECCDIGDLVGLAGDLALGQHDR